MPMSILKTMVPYLTGIGLLLGIGCGIHHHGYNRGAQDVRLEWANDRAVVQAVYDQLKEELAAQETAHRAANTRITHELAEALRSHDLALAGQRRVYEHRLLSSEARVDTYRRQAEGGAAECRDLAGHAARLDRTLEEGRALVRELGETLGFRDQQLKQLGAQIRSDRQLLEGDTHGNR